MPGHTASDPTRQIYELSAQVEQLCETLEECEQRFTNMLFEQSEFLSRIRANLASAREKLRDTPIEERLGRSEPVIVKPTTAVEAFTETPAH